MLPVDGLDTLQSREPVVGDGAGECAEHRLLAGDHQPDPAQRPALSSKVSRSSGAHSGASGSRRSRSAAAARLRRRSRMSSGALILSDARLSCRSSQYGHGSSAGHRSGPPTELSCTVGAPGRGCSRVAVRASGASCGKSAVTSNGRGGVVIRTAFMAVMLPAASDNGCTGPRQLTPRSLPASAGGPEDDDRIWSPARWMVAVFSQRVTMPRHRSRRLMHRWTVLRCS